MRATRHTPDERDIGTTCVGPRTARLYVAALAILLAVAAALEWKTALPAAWREWSVATAERSLLAANRALISAMHLFEERLRADGWLTGRVVAPAQRFKVEHLRLATERVLVGADGWLHFRPDVDALAMRGSPSQDEAMVRAVREFAAQLRARGITLVLLPVPGKTAHTADTLVAGLPPRVGAERWQALLRQLADTGAVVVDCEQAWRDGALDGVPYLRTDTHWTFPHMDAVARAVASRVREVADVSAPPVAWERDEAAVSGVGDLAGMLGAGWPPGLDAAQVQTVRVVRVGDRVWQADPASPVLLLGDSFSNIYSMEALGWGEGAGFAEQLSVQLGFGVDRIVRNDAGAWATRDQLSRELARGRDRLAGKRVVVWQFAAREAVFGDWRSIPMALGEPAPSAFLAAPAGGADWCGRVAAIAPMPVPGRVPYADHIVAVHLADIDVPGVPSNVSAYVFAWSMTNHTRTAAGRLRPGDTACFRVRPWSAVAEVLEGVNRSELDGDEFWQAEMVWGELIP
jgi:alginate O-acetyltransferase complex protein AlgJ